MADDQDQDKQFQNQSQKIHICLSSNDAEKYASMEVAQAQIWTVINIHEVSTLSPVRPHWRHCRLSVRHRLLILSPECRKSLRHSTLSPVCTGLKMRSSCLNDLAAYNIDVFLRQYGCESWTLKSTDEDRIKSSLY